MNTVGRLPSIVTETDITGYAPKGERFSAYDADTYEPGCHVGTGATAAEAIADLLEQLEDAV